MTIRRLKTYAGSQGYVYQYYFVGQRPAGEGTEYVFDVTSDRKITYPVTLILPADVVAAWSRSHGRALSDTEQYASAKMRLFRAFDEVEDVTRSGLQFRIDLPALESALSSLGIE